MELKDEQSECCWSKRGVEKHQDLEAKGREKKRTKRARTSSEIEYHIVSERKRRQNIAEKFIALSATIPGLKKVSIYLSNLCYMYLSIYLCYSILIHGVYLLSNTAQQPLTIDRQGINPWRSRKVHATTPTTHSRVGKSEQ